jgi:hypothetical protein
MSGRGTTLRISSEENLVEWTLEPLKSSETGDEKED